MGAFLVYYGVPLLALAVGSRPIRRALPYFAAFLVVVRATLYTFSRGAYLALAGGSATVLLFGNPLLLAAAGGGGAVAVALFPSLVPASVVERFDETTTSKSVYEGDGAEVNLDKSSAHRLVIWRGAARMIAAQPLRRRRPRPVPADDRLLHRGPTAQDRSARRAQRLHPRGRGDGAPVPRAAPPVVRGVGNPGPAPALRAPPPGRPEPRPRLPGHPGRRARERHARLAVLRRGAHRLVLDPRRARRDGRLLPRPAPPRRRPA